MKVMVVLGTRPEIVRLSLVIKLLDEFAELILVHTGQNSDDKLNGVFFRELGIGRTRSVSKVIRQIASTSGDPSARPC